MARGGSIGRQIARAAAAADWLEAWLARRAWLPAVLLALALVPTIAPLAAVDWFGSYDGELHRWRLWHYWQAWRDGQIPVRWGADLAFGLGGPLFTFYSPLTYLIGIVPMAWGASTAAALRLAFMLSLGLGATGMFALARWWYRASPGRAWAGLLAACAFLYAPYVLGNVYRRGAIAEALALGLTPWLLLGVGRWLAERRALDALLLAGATAAIILAHALTAISVAAIGALVVAAWLLEPRPRPPRLARDLAGLAAAVGLGAAAAAFAWLPVRFEIDSVRFERAVGGLGRPVYPDHLFSLPELIQYRFLHDYRLDFAAVPPHLAHLGLVSTIVTAAAIGRMAIGRGWTRPAVALGLGLGASLYLASRSSAWLWDALPALQLFQFPWRFLGPAGLFAALLTAQLAVGARRGRLLALALGLALAVGGGAIRLEPIAWDRVWDSTPNAIGFERATSLLGLSSFGEYAPIWQRRPLPPLLTAADRPSAPDPDPSAPPEIEAVVSGDELALRTQAAAATALTVDWAYFPGWQLTIDGRPAEPAPTGDLGLVGLTVPAGERTIALRRVRTPVEAAADAVSAAGLLGLFALGLLAVARRRSARAGLLGLAALGTIGVAVAPTIGALGAAGAVQARAALRPAGVPVGPRAIAVTLDSARLSTSGLLEVALLVWSPGAPPASTPRVRLRLVDERGALVGESEHPLGGGVRPVAMWQPNMLLHDRFELRLAGPSAPARVRLTASIDQASSEAELPTVGGDSIASMALPTVAGGSVASVALPPVAGGSVASVALPTVAGGSVASVALPIVGNGSVASVRLPALYPPREPRGDRPLTIGGLVRLEDIARETVRAAPPPHWLGPVETRAPVRGIRGGLLLRPLADAPRPVRLHVRLRDTPGRTLNESTIEAAFPPGQTELFGAFDLPFPEPPLPGRYYLELSATAADGTALPLRREADGVTVQVVRLWTEDIVPACVCVPDDGVTLGLDLPDGLRLIGYRSERRVDGVDAVLYWQARERPRRRETFFIHALDLAGNRVGQLDGPAYDDGRPTVAWEANDAVAVAARLAFSAPGPIRLRAGIYEGASGVAPELTPGRPYVALGVVGRRAPAVARGDDFEHGIRLLGYTAERVGATPIVTLVWQASERLADSYAVFVHLVDQTGAIVAQGDGPPELGERATSEWPIGSPIVDPHPIDRRVADGVRLRVGLYRRSDGVRLPTRAGADAVDLGVVTWPSPG